MRLAAALLLLLCVRAAAEEAAPEAERAPIRAGVRQTLGSQGYLATNAYADFGSTWRGRLSYRQYRSDASSGTFRNYSARASYEEDDWSAGVSAGISPKTTGYKSTSFGLDATRTWEPREEGVVGYVETSGWFTRIQHAQDLPPAPALGRPASTQDIAQSDLGASVSVKLWSLVASADAVKSVYNKDVAQIATVTSRFFVLRDVDATLTGFPKDSWTLRLEYEDLPYGLLPHVSWTRTVYKVAQPASSAATAGLEAEVMGATVFADYERVSQRGTADKGYFGFGARRRF